MKKKIMNEKVNKIGFSKLIQQFMPLCMLLVTMIALDRYGFGNSDMTGSSLLPSVNAQSCPKFTCNGDSNMNYSGVCFKHSADDPVTEIKVELKEIVKDRYDDDGS